MTHSASASVPRRPRVVVGVSGSSGSITALRRAVQEARRIDAELWAVSAWDVPGGTITAEDNPAPPLLVEQRERRAFLELFDVIDRLFGDDGPGVPVHLVAGRGSAGRVLVQVADRESDVLVVGAGRRGRVRRVFGRPVSRYCLAHAVCPVLAVPPSALEAALAAARRHRIWRLRLDVGRLKAANAPGSEHSL
ncbi:universal stress protein [Streptomyces chiangmaiensis]|uniref:Universal stress protein n=1 Tax=Streptomyces chiangmaiensis TaxID=766497 RepID=A0ABU7FXM1_9ACTN|nr:universal stress protein [Streptomyces chiangmaiensis]MED7828318.1 universal stress protein [Streptomyces chiangmaiensis]